MVTTKFLKWDRLDTSLSLHFSLYYHRARSTLTSSLTTWTLHKTLRSIDVIIRYTVYHPVCLRLSWGYKDRPRRPQPTPHGTDSSTYDLSLYKNPTPIYQPPLETRKPIRWDRWGRLSITVPWSTGPHYSLCGKDGRGRGSMRNLDYLFILLYGLSTGRTRYWKEGVSSFWWTSEIPQNIIIIGNLFFFQTRRC